ncbi:hypothetical protein B0J18DRAFT_434932 [Chaetomium sp. MPI-SDFR-AT-0129]|nr:hypothetical protein B0J18DRAFT_434932 [Chaetomium sp. MPI-SDFR-AT-0129]
MPSSPSAYIRAAPPLGVGGSGFGHWGPGPGPMPGGPPPLGYQSMMYHPDYTVPGDGPMQYGTPAPAPATDPAWLTPELPLLPARNTQTSGARSSTARKKTARLSLSVAGAGDGTEEENDMFLDLDPSSVGGDKENGNGMAVKKQLLLPRPPPEKQPLPGKRPRGRPRKRPLGQDKGVLKPEGVKKTAAITTPPKPKTSVAPTSASVKQNKTGRQSTPTNTQNSTSPPSKDTAALERGRRSPSLYLSVSDGEQKHAEKPRNQTLCVEIAAGKLPDARAFRLLTPELSEQDSQPCLEADVTRAESEEALESGQPTTAAILTANDRAASVGTGYRDAAGEVFSRNFVDPAYAFSDDEEPAVSRLSARKPKKTDTPKRVPKAVAAVLSLALAEPSSGRAASPTLSVGLDTGAVDTANDLPEPPEHQQASTQKQTSKSQPQETPARQSLEPRTTSSGFLRQPQKNEIPETSPNVQLTVTPSVSTHQPRLYPEIQASDPPLPEDQDAAQPNSRVREPSPTLTDPNSRPEPSPSLTQQTQPQPPTPNPHTPVKTPTRGRPKGSRTTSTAQTKTNPKPTTAPSTTTKTTTAKKRKSGILSLLQTTTTTTDGLNPDDDTDDDDLSFLTPAKPIPTTTVRSTPAQHHVRLGLYTGPRSGAGGLFGSPSESTTSVATTTKRRRKSGGVSASGGSALGRKASVRKNGLADGGLSTGTPQTPSSRIRHWPAHLREARPGPVRAPGGDGGGDGDGDLVQTPGGTMRRCGEGGFRCEREFCFSCL